MKEFDPIAIKARIKNLIDSTPKLTQEKLAKAIDVAQPTVSSWRNCETPKNMPTIEQLIKLSNYFDVSLDYLICGNLPESPVKKELTYREICLSIHQIITTINNNSLWDMPIARLNVERPDIENNIFRKYPVTSVRLEIAKKKPDDFVTPESTFLDFFSAYEGLIKSKESYTEQTFDSFVNKLLENVPNEMPSERVEHASAPPFK